MVQTPPDPNICFYCHSLCCSNALSGSVLCAADDGFGVGPNYRHNHSTACFGFHHPTAETLLCTLSLSVQFYTTGCADLLSDGLRYSSSQRSSESDSAGWGAANRSASDTFTGTESSEKLHTLGRCSASHDLLYCLLDDFS